MSDLRDSIALSFLPAWCRLRAAEPLRRGCAPGGVLEQLVREHWPDEPERLAMLHQRATAAIRRAREIEHLEVLAVPLGSEAYPAMLGVIDDPPPVLWLRALQRASTRAMACLGAPEQPAQTGGEPVSELSERASERYMVFEAPAVAIVGSRAASPYAVAVAEKLAADLVAHGVVVVSGLARGVDAAAHRGALAGKGLTIAVLGCGVDVIYPPEHAPLARSIEVSGVLVSELVPGTPPRPWCFPMRNRIISGLAHAVVVIEAREKSGALITARCALEQGRDVLAVPGNVLNGRNRGTHGLLKDGAKIVESADDILEELGMRGAPSTSGASRQMAGTDPILACLALGEPLDLDSIAGRSGLTAARILPRLLELELQGVVARVAGGWVRQG
jgi:DNA protecting protein DprA